MRMLTLSDQFHIDRLIDKQVDGILDRAELEAFGALVEGTIIDEEGQVSCDYLTAYVVVKRLLQDNPDPQFKLTYWNGLYEDDGNLITNDRSCEDVIAADISGNADGKTTLEELFLIRGAMCAKSCDLSLLEIPLDNERSVISPRIDCLFDFETKEGLRFDKALHTYHPATAKRVNDFLDTIKTHEESKRTRPEPKIDNRKQEIRPKKKLRLEDTI